MPETLVVPFFPDMMYICTHVAIKTECSLTIMVAAPANSVFLLPRKWSRKAKASTDHSIHGETREWQVKLCQIMIRCDYNYSICTQWVTVEQTYFADGITPVSSISRCIFIHSTVGSSCTLYTQSSYKASSGNAYSTVGSSCTLRLLTVFKLIPKLWFYVKIESIYVNWNCAF